jgi:hypothetical protein
MRKPEQDILYKVHLLEELIENQSRVIDTASLIIDGKNKMVNLCEEEIRIYKRENATLKLMCIVSFIVIVALSSILLVTGL